MNKFELFSRVALCRDVPQYRLRQGDVATIVDYHPVVEGESGYSLEVFNGLGETIAVLSVPESHIEPLGPNTVLNVRTLEKVR